MFCCVLFPQQNSRASRWRIAEKNTSPFRQLLSGKNLRSKYQMLDCQRVHMICAASDLKRFAQGNIHEWTGNGPLPCMQGRAGVG
jgi:hypothetical protein